MFNKLFLIDIAKDFATSFAAAMIAAASTGELFTGGVAGAAALGLAAVVSGFRAIRGDFDRVLEDELKD